MKSRAERRHHKERMKNRAKTVRKWWNDDREEFQYGRICDHLAVCSCSMCGNPRKYYNKETIQEIKARIKYEEETGDFRGKKHKVE